MEKRRTFIPALLYAAMVPTIFLIILLFPVTRKIFQTITESHPYIIAFIKFAFLATTGEILACKISAGVFNFPSNAVAKAAVWGLIGMMIALLFPVYLAGVKAAQDSGLLFGKGNILITALLTSIINNLTFGLAMMAFHRISDTMIELKSNGKPARVLDAVRAVDWTSFVDFVVFRTIPFFWIPAHWVTFMLPSQYRVFLSAFLSIILGLLLAAAKRKT